jgi:hypothetical protein
MALMAMPLANGDLAMNHSVSEKWPWFGNVWQCLKKRALKAGIPPQNFIGHISEKSTRWSRGRARFAYAASGEHRKSYPRRRKVR